MRLRASLQPLYPIHIASANTKCDTHAPLAMNDSASRTCSGLSRTTKRTSTFVSTARMLLADVFSNSLFHTRGATATTRPTATARTRLANVANPAGS
jgi:hypothetical protein